MVSIVDTSIVATTGRVELSVAGKSVAEIMDPNIGNMVLQKAAELGLHRPGISNATGPYPVDAEGKTDDELLLGKRGPIDGYRRDFVALASI